MSVRRAFLYFAFLLSTILAGCKGMLDNPIAYENGSPLFLSKIPTDWAFSCGFPEEFKPTVRSSFSFWNRMARQKIFQENSACDIITPSTGIVVFYEQQTDPGAEDGYYTLAEVSRFVGASATLQGADMVFFKEWAEQERSYQIESTARHEIGHILGFNHMKLENCLMYGLVLESDAAKPVKGLCPQEYMIFYGHYGKKRN